MGNAYADLVNASTCLVDQVNVYTAVGAGTHAVGRLLAAFAGAQTKVPLSVVVSILRPASFGGPPPARTRLEKPEKLKEKQMASTSCSCVLRECGGSRRSAGNAALLR